MKGVSEGYAGTIVEDTHIDEDTCLSVVRAGLERECKLFDA